MASPSPERPVRLRDERIHRDRERDRDRHQHRGRRPDQRREHSREVAITPNGQYAYVANNVSDNVSVISTATNLVVQTISAPGGPDGLAITPNGEFVYVSEADADAVTVISTATNTVVGSPIDVGASPTAWPWRLTALPCTWSTAGELDGRDLDCHEHVVGAPIDVGSAPTVWLSPLTAPRLCRQQRIELGERRRPLPRHHVAEYGIRDGLGVLLGQLTTGGATGAVTYATTASSPWVSVSSQGAVSSLATAPVGTYTTSEPSPTRPAMWDVVVHSHRPAEHGPGLVQGYWEVASDGGVFSFTSRSSARWWASPEQARRWHRGRSGRTGLLEVASDGGVFAFGSAAFEGSMGGKHLNAPVVGTAADPQGQATGRSHPTAACSLSAAPRSTARWAAST